jgi:hypothetical protein
VVLRKGNKVILGECPNELTINGKNKIYFLKFKIKRYLKRI